jgi:hypothetical protein
LLDRLWQTGKRSQRSQFQKIATGKRLRDSHVAY